MTNKISITFLASVIGLAPIMAISAVKVQILQRIKLPKTHYEIGMALGEFPPNTLRDLSRHSGVEVGYVLEGNIVLSIQNQTPKTIRAGESFQIPAYVLHHTKAGPKGAKVLATWVVTQGKPMSLPASVSEKLAALEASTDGRIGLSAVNTANNKHLHYRAEERFPMGCTSKVVAVSAILKKSMRDPHLLQQKVTYKKEDLVSWSPITSKHATTGMTVTQLCAAAIIVSDNTATNLLVKKLGGPKGITAFARSIGDTTFRADRWWPDVATSIPGDLRDTSTPTAMEKTLQRIALGDVLAAPQREKLQTWLKNNTTGNFRIRAGVPKGWIVGDKTGSGTSYGTTNDIAVIWPPKHAPLVVAIYFTRNKKDAAKREDIVASVTRIVLSAFAQSDPSLKLKSTCPL